MATVTAGSSATETLSSRSTITISSIDGTERANIVVLRAGAQVFGDRVSNGASVGPFEAGDVLLISAEGGSIDYTVTAFQTSVSEGVIADGVTLISPVDPLADTKRIRTISYQKQEPENDFNGGEPFWLDTAPLAKNMITWRLPINPATRNVLAHNAGPFADSDWLRTVWVGAHWFAQDQADDNNPTDIHGHWSVEVPDETLALRTRFGVYYHDRTDKTKVGCNQAIVAVSLSDFRMGDGRFILTGSHSNEHTIEFSRTDEALAGRRWTFGTNGLAESGSNVGADIRLRRFNDAGTAISTTMYVRRSTGEITWGSEDFTPASDPSQMMVRNGGGAQNGMFIYPSAALTTGAAYKARLSADTEVAYASRTGGAVNKFQVRADGQIAWGDGTNAVDTFLSRSASNRLATPGELDVTRSVRIGGATARGSVGAICMLNASTLPTIGAGSGGVIYVDAGALKYLGASGTVTTLGAA